MREERKTGKLERMVEESGAVSCFLFSLFCFVFDLTDGFNLNTTMMPNRGSSGSNNRSRFQSRQEEIRRQEELLLLKKREIEARLNAASQGNSTDRDGCSTTIVSASTSPQQESSTATTTSAVPSPTPVVNKFENNGSFLELFRKMQESGAIPQEDKGKNEDEDTDKGR